MSELAEPFDAQLPVGEQLPVEKAADPNNFLATQESALIDQKNWAQRNRGKLALGAVALSLGITFATNPASELIEKTKETAPYVAVGMGAMEALWLGGAAMMLSSVGSKVKNPFKIKSHIKDIAQKANDSNTFKAGFWINTSGAVGEFVIPAVAVTTNFPVETWGVLAPSLVDLGLTIVIRKAILDGVKEHSQSE